MSRSSGGESPGPDFASDENRVRVSDQSRARLYFAQTNRGLDALHRVVEGVTGTINAESSAVDAFLRRLRSTFESLALRHFYAAATPELKIDATDSGFPHWSVLLEVAADLRARDEELAQIPAPADIKREMLDRIVQHGIHPRDLQQKLLRRLYLESLAEDRLFRAFVPGEFAKAGAADDPSNHFWSFATYDRGLNRPFVYLVYFSWDGGRPLAEDADAQREIREVAEHVASGRINLLAVSNRLDERLPRMRPRIVKRLILGPFASPAFTREDGALGALLHRLADRLPFLLRFESETLVSERETRVGAGWLSKGQLRQVFWIPNSIDLSRRGVSQLERFALCPHWLTGYLRDAELLHDHRHVSIDEDGHIHGLD